MFTRRRTLERLDQDNYSNLCWLSHCECCFPLLCWLTSSMVDQTEHKWQQAHLDLEGSAALQVKKCRKVQTSKHMASHLFINALKESGVCGLLSNILLWITATALPVCPRRYFCCICRWKGDLQMSYGGTRYFLLKCKGAHKAEKDKV